ncbi:MAG: hypothetical protein ACOCP8_04540 [archaeon]
MDFKIITIDKNNTVIQAILYEQEIDIDSYFKKLKEVNEGKIIYENENYLTKEFTMANDFEDLVNVKKIEIGKDNQETIKNMICNIIMNTDLDITSRLSVIVKSLFPREIINTEEKLEKLPI